MTELDTLMAKALESEGNDAEANKFYTALFRTRLFMPATLQDDEEEPFAPIYLQDGENYFIPAFDQLERLSAWAADEFEKLDYVEIDGADVIRCVGTENVFLSLNPGTEFYKEFRPDEVHRLKMMIGKIDKLKSTFK